MSLLPFQLTLWDVGHGLAIWIQTPFGHNHWVDTGCLPEFSPAHHVYNKYGVREIDYLTISHPDKDHFDDLEDFLHWFGGPRIFHRNPSVFPDEKYGGLGAGYQQAFLRLDSNYKAPLAIGTEPWNPNWNGGVSVHNCYLDRREVSSINDSSIVSFYTYAGWLFVMPGDIGDAAWQELWKREGFRIQPVVNSSKARILVAPHHGRASGYSDAMMSDIKPHLVVISDEFGKEPTDNRFRTNAIGLEHNWLLGNLKPISYLSRIFDRPHGLAGLLTSRTNDIRFLSTKTAGRLKFSIDSLGECILHIIRK